MNTEHHTDGQVQADLNAASSTFRSETPQQFAQQPQYQYGDSHHTSAPFTIDTDMSNIDSFTANVHDSSSTNTPMNVTSADSETAGHLHAHTTSSSIANNIDPAMSIATPTTPGMAPPQPNQAHRTSIGQGHSQQIAYSPTAPRPSIDEIPDGSLGGGDSKRKRSKVSRACDECRRKKVRCDAAGDDGTIKTCTNCVKAGAICGYNRVPLKRGPSKGYIKELSERVQQVESQMAMSGTPGTFRQSIDGTAGGMYADQSLYSPEDNMSFKRNFSFSDQQAQRTPFTNPDYNRDRIPSIGWNAVSPHTSGFRGSMSAGDRPRDRGSVAIAPDQQLPIPPAKPLSVPFWMAGETDNEPAAKRLKLDVSSEDQVDAPAIGQEFLGKYYTEFHANLPVLPDADVSIEIVKKAKPQIQHAFVAAVRFLPLAKVKKQGGQINGETLTQPAPDIFKTRKHLQDFMLEAAKDNPSWRSREDNLLLLWTYLLMAVEAENDLARLRGGNFSKAMIIKQAVDLGWSCILLEDRRKEDPAVLATELNEIEVHKQHLVRVWNCAGILARLHALSVGSTNPMPYQQDTPLPRPSTVFPLNQVYLTRTSIALGTVFNLIHSKFAFVPFNQDFEVDRRNHFLGHIDDIFEEVQLDDNAKVQAQHIRLFYNLLSSRFTLIRSPVEVLDPAFELASALKDHTMASQEKHIYNPIDMHLFTLTTITLLEFIQDGVRGTLEQGAKEAIANIKHALEQISERDSIDDQQQEPAANELINNETNNPSNDKVTSAVEQIATESPKPIHWANSLLTMIERRTKANEVAVVSAVVEQNGNGNGQTEGSSNNSNKNEYEVAVDFSKLLKYGYLNVLAESAGV